MSETLTMSRGVPSFETTTELREAMNAKANFVNRDLYPRDGSRTLGEIEAKLANLVGVSEHEVLAYGSGMSATTGAIDIGLHLSDKNKPFIACAQESYSQSKRYVEHFLNGPRNKVTYIDSGDPAHVERLLRRDDIDVLVSETISNYVNMPVLNVQHLLDVTRQLKKPPVVILDNTLPLSTGLPIGEMLEPDDRIIVVESGTKSYSFNQDTLGVSYTKNEELLHWLRRYRRTRGDLPGSQSQELIADLLPDSRESFDARNKRLFKTTGKIALTLATRGQEVDDDRFYVAHPAIPTHENAELYNVQHPDGGAPVLYITATPSSQLDQHDVIERLWSSPDVREQARLGQSFGFDDARIIYDEYQPVVRVAGGANSNGNELGAALANALYN
ncbi:MAG: PLP-dependent transferase [Candidatus Saccharimonadales bacterium]